MNQPARHHASLRARPGGRAGRRRQAGFTIVEMLVTVAMIIVLLSILLFAVGIAGRSAQTANTSFLLSSISQALARFRSDVGYLPPVLGQYQPPPDPCLHPPTNPRDTHPLPDPDSPGYVDCLQMWYSHTSLGEYLLGYGDRTQDGYGVVGDPQLAFEQFPDSPGVKEVPTLGLRDPGPDGVWGAWTNPRRLGPGQLMPANGSLESRNLTPFLPSPPSIAANNDLLPGRVLGPYLDLKDERLVGRLGREGISFPGDALYNESDPAVIVDYWGRPIRYYRRLHLPADPRTPDLRSNLGDVVALRPWTLKPGTEADGVADFLGDTSTSKALQTAEFALFSSGPDRDVNPIARVDVAPGMKGVNRDNMVEIGQ